YQCNRCHEGTGQGAPAAHQACVGCHDDVLSGRRPIRADMADRIRHELVSLRFAPSLTAAGAHLRRDSIAPVVLQPHELRPRLRATMPRLALTAEQARDIAAYLAKDAPERHDVTLDPNDVERGRKLVVDKGCASCHALGVFGAELASEPSAGAPETR